MQKYHDFTSESVSEGHPDKVADQISDAVLDAYLSKDPLAKVACETLITHGVVILAGEVSSKHRLSDRDLHDIVCGVIRDIGYTEDALGFNCTRFEFQNHLHRQSGNIGKAVEHSNGTLGAGDQGLMFGHAVAETDELMPLPITLAHRLVQRQAEVRRSGIWSWLGPDAKSQVTVRYCGDNPACVTGVVLSTQHLPGVEDAEISETVIEHIIKPTIPERLLKERCTVLVNPSGRFEIGGPKADTGLTGRKIIVDTYGGSCPHGGGAFSGKDPTKVDRSAAYMARYLAKNIVAAGLAAKCTIQLSYAIGKADPTSFYVDLPGTGRVDEVKVEAAVRDMVDLTPLGIISRLDLRRPIYLQAAVCGHFGRELPDFTWERTDLVEPLQAAFGICDRGHSVAEDAEAAKRKAEEDVDRYYMGRFGDEPGHEEDLSGVAGSGERIGHYRKTFR
jgi:S-adenosylmethionine synthetase